ncbi:MAG: YraN family protein [Bryobacterales bacterium]|nr:YraN family protein [Bryobacterales bacterium]
MVQDTGSGLSIAKDLTKACSAQKKVQMPDWWLGTLGEQLVIVDLVGNGFDGNKLTRENVNQIKNESDNGIDIIVEAPGGSLYFFEVKTTETGKPGVLSKAQKDPEDFVLACLADAASRNGRFARLSDDDVATAKRLYRLVTKGPPPEVQYIKADVMFPPKVKPTDPVDMTYSRWDTGDVIDERWAVDDASTYSYMIAAEMGAMGEGAVIECLKKQGFDVLKSLHNNSGNGIDIIARHPGSGRLCFLEVKTTTRDVAGKLQQAQRDAEGFARLRLERALEGTHGWPPPDDDTKKVICELLDDMTGDERYLKANVYMPQLGKSGSPVLVFEDWKRE